MIKLKVTGNCRTIAKFVVMLQKNYKKITLTVPEAYYVYGCNAHINTLIEIPADYFDIAIIQKMEYLKLAIEIEVIDENMRLLLHKAKNDLHVYQTCMTSSIGYPSSGISGKILEDSLLDYEELEQWEERLVTK